MRLDSEEIDRRARTIYMAMDPSVSYADAVRFVVEDAENGAERLQFAGADAESLKLHERVLALIQAEKEKGNFISYRDAVRRVEQERAKR
jgi:hypothetical protein